MMDAWHERLEEAVRKDGRKPRSISIAAGLGPNYLSELFTKRKVPSVDKFLRLCAELRVSATFVLTGSEVSLEGEEMLGLLADMDVEAQATILNLARQLSKASRS
jgi:transcriptional regulator with XRE-family HTH domain